MLDGSPAAKNEATPIKQDSEPPVFDSSRFSDDQLMSKKAMKRKRQVARRNIDVSIVLGESSTSNPKKKKTDEDSKVEEVDYTQEDSSAFGNFSIEKRLPYFCSRKICKRQQC